MQVEREQEPRAAERLPDAIAGFRVVRRLATGGTSDVLLARAKGAEGAERTVVLKLLLAQYKDDPSFERMFAVEAAAYGRLEHPSIVKLYDFFASGDQLVMVLEHVDGLPLNVLRAELTNVGEILDDRAALYVMSHVFAALAAAHAARDPETGEFAPVVHRDVNPSNVLIHRDGGVKLADFGIAKVTGMAGDTKQGFIKGTFGYMSPEQVRGEQVSVRADVYAATLLLWELLARRRAIQHGALSDLEALRAMAHPNIVSLDVLRGDLPASLRSIIARGLEPAADKRNVTADEFALTLTDAVPEEEGRQRLVKAIEKVHKPDDPVLATTAPVPVDESVARLAEMETHDSSADATANYPAANPDDLIDDVPPLPSYSVPAPPLSDMDLVDTRLNATPYVMVPEDLPTKPADANEIRAMLAADDSLELPGFPMPSASEPAPPNNTPSSKPTMRPDPKDALAKDELDRATDAPANSPRSKKKGTRLGLGSLAPRPAVPRPMSSAPPRPLDLKPPSTPPNESSLSRPQTILGGFSAKGSSPPPAEKERTSPMAVVPMPRPSQEAPLTKTLGMPGAPSASSSPPPFPSSPPMSPEPSATASTDTQNAAAAKAFRSLPTAPASFAPRSFAPPAIQASNPPPPEGAPYGWIALGAFVLTAAVIAMVVAIASHRAVTIAKTSVVASSNPNTPSSAPASTTTTAVSASSAAKSAVSAIETASTTSSSTPSVSSAVSAASAAAAASSAPSTTATAVETTIPPHSGAIVASAAASQHRVFVDGKIVGEGAGTYFVSCGAHTVKIGSSGKPRDIDVACGASVNVP